jgi:hypothetical protein
MTILQVNKIYQAFLNPNQCYILLETNLIYINQSIKEAVYLKKIQKFQINKQSNLQNRLVHKNIF